MESFLLSKSIYSEEDIRTGIEAYNQYIDEVEITENEGNFILGLQIRNGPGIAANEVLGNLLNYILMSSVESKAATE